MKSRACGWAVFLLVMATLNRAGGVEPPLVGRWVAPTPARTMEFLADGNLVILDEMPGVQYVRKPDGGFTSNAVTSILGQVGVYQVLPGGQLLAELVTGGQSHARTNWWTWRVDDARTTLTLTAGGTNTVLRRADLPVSELQRPLIGLWRRTGKLPLYDIDMGILYTPGGLGVYIGKGSPWDERSGGGVAGYFCRIVAYQLPGAEQLRETDLGSIRPRERVRPFRVTGRHLQIGPPGRYSLLHYDQVRGKFAFLDGRFNLQHWAALPLLRDDTPP